MRVMFVTSEAYPLAKTGGLADVSRALPAALQRLGADARVVLPGYPRAISALRNGRVAAHLPETLGYSGGKVLTGCFPDCDVPVYLIYCPALFGRDGGLYQDDEGRDWPDNAKRFAYFSQVAADIALGRTAIGWRPGVVHANDWHTGLVPLFLKRAQGQRPVSVFTTHNMAFQGLFSHDEVPLIFHDGEDIEYYGRLSYLKAGLAFADRVTTVSPTYAKEILTPEFGFGLEGVLAARGGDFRGILNGIDEAIWNPATDPFIAANYSLADPGGKQHCKAALQQETELPEDSRIPVLGFVSRLTEQKMADTLIEALPYIAGRAQLVVIGEGERKFETALLDAQSQYPQSVSVTIGYDERLAHRLQSGADILLAPARFEPCGLTQLYGLRYGTPPVVRRTGGLADTVVDTTNKTLSDRSASGFVFDDSTSESMISALSRALDLYRDPLHWRVLQRQAMSRAFGWDASAAAYLTLYQTGGGETEQSGALRAAG